MTKPSQTETSWGAWGHKVNDSGIRSQLERAMGGSYRRKNGRVAHVVESYEIDRSYEDAYGFIVGLVKLRNVGTGRAKRITLSELRSEWTEA